MAPDNDDKIIRVGTWEELDALPGYVGVVDKDGVTLGRFRGKYAMKGQPMRPCAIKQCRTKHREGAVISLSDGSKTNIGHRCGRKYFPQQWDMLKREFTVREKNEQREMQFATLQEQAKAVLAAIATFNPRIIAYKKIRDDFANKMPPAVLEELTRRAERGDSRITRPRAQTKEERETSSVSGLRTNQSGAVDEVIGNLSGLGVLNLINDPWRIATYEIHGPCTRVLALSSSESSAFRFAARHWPAVTSAVSRVERGLALGDMMFSDANLKAMSLLRSAVAARLVSVRRAAWGGVDVEVRPRFVGDWR